MATRRFDTLICTVGSSFAGNVRNARPEDAARYEVEPGVFEKMLEAYRRGLLQQLGESLALIPDNLYWCGAEINSIAAMRKRFCTAENLVFLVSETNDGRLMGKILEAYYRKRKPELGLGNVSHIVVHKLSGQDADEFRTQGLRNLVREICKIVRTTGGPERVGINATGGYKAQIAFSTAIGLALAIPVFYKHETFDAIELPPLPLSFDYDLLGRYADLFSALEKNMTLSSNQVGDLGDLDARLRALIDEEHDSGTKMWSLSPMGELYIEGYRIRNPRPMNLPPADDEQRKVPTIPGHHWPDGFLEHVLRVWRETPWITTCHSLPYDGQQGIRCVGFELRPERFQNGREVGIRIIGTYVGRTGPKTRFAVLTTGTSVADLTWAVDYLNREYGGIVR